MDRRTDRKTQDLRPKKAEFQLGTPWERKIARYDNCWLEPSDKPLSEHLRYSNLRTKKILKPL